MTTAVPAPIAAQLRALTSQTFLQHVEWFPELGSTNDYALGLAAQGSLQLPRLIWAEHQSAGRGRGSHVWWSADGALTFSLMVDPTVWQVPVAAWPQLSLVTGLAVAEALEDFVAGASVRVKWPNDVYVDQRKVCGILTERPAQPGANCLVIGIGVNVANTLSHDAPAELRAAATSVREHAHAAVAPHDVLIAILQRWDEGARKFGAGEFDLPTRWQRRCFLTDHRVRVTTGQHSVEGVCRGIDRDGALLVETPRGLLRQVAGTVRRLDA